MWLVRQTWEWEIKGPLLFDLLGWTFPYSSQAKGDQVPCCWGSLPCVRNSLPCEQLSHLHQVWFPPLFSTYDGDVNNEEIHKYQKNFCPNLNKNWFNLSPLCVSSKLGCIENSKCLAMPEFNYHLVWKMHSFQGELAFEWRAKGWVILSIYSVEREIHYRMENRTYFKNVQRYTTK